jgi:hypothetical protein
MANANSSAGQYGPQTIAKVRSGAAEEWTPSDMETTYYTLIQLPYPGVISIKALKP